jgi:hypothetical protein
MRTMILAVGLLASVASAQTSCPIPSPTEVKAKGVFEAAMLRAKPLGKPKGEFETSADYAARMEKGVSAVAPNGSITFPWVVDLTSFKFDADSGAVSYGRYALGIDCEVNLKDPSYSLRPFCFQQEVRETTAKPKTMTNGYGAQVEVTTVHDDYVGVILGKDHPSSGPLGYSSQDLFSFHASVAEAQSLKKNAVMVLRFTPKPPLYLEGGHYYGATVSDPIERFGENYMIVGDLECASLADVATGKVFQTVAIGATP